MYICYILIGSMQSTKLCNNVNNKCILFYFILFYFWFVVVCVHSIQVSARRRGERREEKGEGRGRFEVKKLSLNFCCA